MRLLIVFILLCFVVVVYGQEPEPNKPDSLTPIKLEYKLADSAEVWERAPLINIHFPYLVSYSNANGTILAYSNNNGKQWVCFPLPFTEPTNNFRLINLDGKGKPELIVTGEVLNYGSGGGSGLTGMVIINVDSVPTQLFKVFYGCRVESFGDRNQDGAGAYTLVCERHITIPNRKIIVGAMPKPSKELMEEGDCYLTALPKGTYVMKKGRIQLLK